MRDIESFGGMEVVVSGIGLKLNWRGGGVRFHCQYKYENNYDILPLKSPTINSLSSSLWYNTSLKQQLSQSEDDYEIVAADFKREKIW